MTPMLRLDTPDPVSAWREHVRLRTRAVLLTERNFAALRFRGGGTDLTVGLLAGARWEGGATETRWGASMVSNMPTEEVYTTPDHRLTEGVVRTTRPIHLISGGRVEGLALRFELRGARPAARATCGTRGPKQQCRSALALCRLGTIPPDPVAVA